MLSIARHPALLALAVVSTPILVLTAPRGVGTGIPVVRLAFFAVDVLPKGDTLSINPLSNGFGIFEVTNSGSSATFTFTAVCVGAAVASGCTPNITSSTIGSGGARLVRVNFTTSGTPGDTARVYLKAFDGPPTTTRDSGWVKVTVRGGLVAVSPHTGSQTNVTPNQANRFAEFTITNPGNMTANDAMTFSCLGAAVSNCTLSASQLTIPAGGTAKDTVFFTSGNFSTTGSIKLVASLGTNPTLSDSGVIQVSTVVATIGDSVAPDGGTQTGIAAGMANKSIFTVFNTGTVQSTYDVSVDCSTAPVSGSCTLSSSSLTIPGGQSKPDTVSFTAGSAGAAGRMILTATVQGSSPVVRDTGWIDLAVQGPSNQGAPIINLKGLNPRTSVDRPQCLTIAIGANSAAECGDLRVVHPLTSFRTMNTVRTPMLVYRSNHGEPVGQVAVDVTLLSATAIPDQVVATLTVGGVQKATHTWTGSEWTSVRTRRIAAWYPDLSGTSLVVPYALTVGTKYGGTTYSAPAVTDTLVIVSRTTSPFGAGWWLSGIEQLAVSNMFWVGGDGSTRLYKTVNSTTWVAEALSYGDTIKKVGTEYWRLLPDSVRVVFDANGRHIKTVNRLGHQTTMYWGGGGTLDSIAPPIAPLGDRIRWRLHYFNLDSVQVTDDFTVGGPRSTMIYKNVATNRVTGIRDPDGTLVQFSYHNIGGVALMSERVDKRGSHQQFQFSGYAKVYQTSLLPGSGQEVITHNFWTADNQGLAGSAVPASVDTAVVSTWHDGPRGAGVGDTLRAWVTRFGAPRRIRDANGFETRLGRSDGSFPALVTRMQTPHDGSTSRVVGAVYDSRGRITSVTDSSWSNATTRYSWDPTWDALRGVRSPAGDRDTMMVDVNTGDRTWQQDGRGDSTRVNFTYDTTTRQLASIKGPGAPYQVFTYDFPGNLYRIADTLNLATTYFNNARGERLSTHVDSANTILVTDSLVYDRMGRDTLYRRWADGDTIIVRKTWDSEGNLIKQVQRAKPDRAAIDSSLTQWAYDSAGRPISRTAPDNNVETTTYDGAGNVVSQVNRRGQTITMTYDRLNRLATRLLPQDSISFASTIGDDYVLVEPGDTAVFTYKPDGQIDSAINKNANVLFTYNPNGSVLSTTARIRVFDRSGFGDHTYTTLYGYDLNGRRTSLTPPGLFTPTPANWIYDPQWGGLIAVKSSLGDSIAFTYNGRSELLGIKYPGNLRRSLRYDVVGRVTNDSVFNVVGTTFPRFSANTLRAQTMTRNGQDQLVASSDPASLFREQTASAYAKVGYLTYSRLAERGFGGTGSDTAIHITRDSSRYDPLGNMVQATRKDSLTIGSAHDSISSFRDTLYYLARTGRLSERKTVAGPVRTSLYFYDAAGNTHLERQSVGSPLSIVLERPALYRSDGRLLQVLSRFRTAPPTPGVYREDSTTYRYDALGRRIWLRSRTWCEGGPGSASEMECVTSHARRTIWDGDQELGEIQAASPSANTADLQSVLELDSQFPSFFINVSPPLIQAFDPNPFAGRVLYGPGLVLDQPLSVQRYEYHDWPTYASNLTWPTFTIFPFWNTLGVPTFGAFGDGAAFKPDTLSAGQTQCSLPNSGASDRCAIVQWPQGYSAYDQNRGRPLPLSWQGSLLEAKRDRSGYQYNRNRYYDPKSGRFTQEDPIGLAGGLNLYGFANGDPVNFSDPFGLCTPWPDCWFQGMANWGARRGGALGGAALNVGAALNATSEAFGTNDLGAAIGSGDVGGGALALASMLPVGRGVSGLAKGIAKAIDRAQGAEVAFSQLGKFTLAVWEVAGDKGAGYVKWNRILDEKGSTMRLFKDVYDQGGNYLRRDWYVGGPPK